MDRRGFLAAALGLGAAWAWRGASFSAGGVPVEVWGPGMREGHGIRDGAFEGALEAAAPQALDVPVAVIGSGAAGLSAAWRLRKEGMRGKIAVLSGPERLGNCSARVDSFGGLYPAGAHYLPLPPPEAQLVRELLQDLGVLRKGLRERRPEYDGRSLVCAPMERSLQNGKWAGQAWGQEAELEEFRMAMERMRGEPGGARPFAMPSALSTDEFAALDAVRFSDWLSQEGFAGEGIGEYVGYCMRDDYGAGPQSVSAWAGLHYFCSRGGECSNVSSEAVLAWEGGNSFLAEGMLRLSGPDTQMVPGHCLRASRVSGKWMFRCMGPGGEAFDISAARAVWAAGAGMAARCVEGLDLDPGLLPARSVWLIGAFEFDKLPPEIWGGAELAYDNVVKGSPALGFIRPANQRLRAGSGRETLVSYRALAQGAPEGQRRALSEMGDRELFELAAQDLRQAYGDAGVGMAKKASLVLRPHAMPVPEPGFMSRSARLRQALAALGKEGLHFAHADMTGFSIFEEANWRGSMAAKALLGKEQSGF